MTSMLKRGTVRFDTPAEGPTPPSGARVLLLLAGVAWRRAINQLVLAASGKKSPDAAPAPRRPAAKQPRWVLLLLGAVIALHLAFGAAFLALNFAERVSARVSPLSARVSPPADQAAEAAQSLDIPRAPWPVGPDGPVMVTAVGLLLLLVACSQLAALLGSAKQDLGKGEWDMEWLFTFPVPARTLFLARLLQQAAAGPLQVLYWACWAPFLATVFWHAGLGFWSVPLALGATAYLALLIASLALVVETWAQKRLAPAGRKNLQAVFVLLGSALGLLAMAAVVADTLDPLLVRAARWLPPAAVANPFSLPALLCEGGPAAWGAAAAMLVVGVAAPLGAVRLTEWLVRDGLLATPGAYLGRRERPCGRGRFGGWLRGTVGKEVLLLLRDRAFLVQTLAVPVLIAAYMFLLNWNAGTRLLGDPRHAAMVAFAVGVYALNFSAFHVLSGEGKSLWLLFTFPRSLSSVLLRKTTLWAVFATLYALAVLGIAAVAGMPLTADALVAGGLAVAGVWLFAYLIAAAGVLSPNPLDVNTQRRPSPFALLGFGLLATVYAGAIYSPSAWMKLGQLTLFALLAFAFWQRVQDRIPHLLDPGDPPARRVGLLDGLVAAVAFLNLQGILVALLAVATDLSEGTRWLAAFVAAGGLVALGAFVVLRKVPGLRSATGLAAPATRAVPALLTGAAAGLAAGLFAVAYLFVAGRFEVLRAWRDSVSPSPAAGGTGLAALLSLLALYTVAAPLFEEFIFRGLLYNGLRRTVRPAVAVAASAAIFAAVHSSFAALPVFVLGVAAAVSFERTRWLATPIVAHVVYNAIAVTAGALM